MKELSTSSAVFHVLRISLLKTSFQTWPGLPVYLTPPQMFFGVFAPPGPSAHFSLLSAPLCLLLAGGRDKEGYSARGERRLNVVWWGMWRTAAFICTFTNRLASLPLDHPDLSEPGQGVSLSPLLLATPFPAPAPHLTLLSILLHLLCLPVFACGPSPQNSTAGPLWK